MQRVIERAGAHPECEVALELRAGSLQRSGAHLVGDIARGAQELGLADARRTLDQQDAAGSLDRSSIKSHIARARPRARRARWRSPQSLRFLGELCLELAPSLEVELLENGGGALDGLLGDVELLGDLAVGEAIGGEPGGSQLGGCEDRLRRRPPCAAWPPSPSAPRGHALRAERRRSGGRARGPRGAAHAPPFAGLRGAGRRRARRVPWRARGGRFLPRAPRPTRGDRRVPRCLRG